MVSGVQIRVDNINYNKDSLKKMEKKQLEGKKGNQ